MPAERKIEGMVGPMSVADNMTLAKQKARCVGPLVSPRKQASLVDRWIDRLSIRTPQRSTWRDAQRFQFRAQESHRVWPQRKAM